MYSYYRILFVFFFLAKVFATNESAKDRKDKNNYVCLNGKVPNKLSRKDILKEFAKGPCSPLIIAPALLSTRLRVEIDCETLKEKNPDLFNLCGWKSCKRGSKNKPRSEYQLWIPEFFGPFNIFKHNENRCWNNFIQLAIDTTKPLPDSVVEKPGFRVKVFGQTPETKKDADCSDGANKNLLGKLMSSIKKKTRYLGFLFDKLKRMGYVAGLTYKNLPYDFRLSYRENQINTLFKPSLETIYKLTGKKVVLLGHSLGNVNIYHQLSKLRTNTKKKMIKSWISVGSAVGGALQAFNTIVAGNGEFIYLFNKVGLHFKSEIIVFNKMFSAYELLPIDFFTYHKDEPWLKAFESRILYEKGEVDHEFSGFKFLPKLEEKCTPVKFANYTTECKMGLFDYREKYIIKIQEDEYKVNEIEKMLTKYNMTDSTLDIFKMTRDEEMIKLKNPEVPVISINLRTGSTVEQYYYNKNITENLEKKDYPKSKKKIGYGDGVLSSTTQLAGPLKWAFEYDEKKKNAQPVKLIDFCSTYEVKNNIYDNVNEKRGNTFIENEFSGIKCECMGKNSPKDCDHSNMMVDSHVLDLIANVLKSNERSYTHIDKSIDHLNEEELVEMTKTCSQLESDTQNNLLKRII